MEPGPARVQALELRAQVLAQVAELARLEPQVQVQLELELQAQALVQVAELVLLEP